jgi:hypothetical protein
VAHACNPSYSGSTEQEDCSSKPVLANSSGDPILKKATTKRAGRVAQGEGPKFKLQYCKKKKKVKTNTCRHTHMHICMYRYIYIAIAIAVYHKFLEDPYSGTTDST